MATITPDQFYDFLVNNIAKYSTNVQNAIKNETDKLSTPAKEEVKSYSYKINQTKGHLYRTGDYRKGWRVRTLTKGGVYKRKIYNSKKPTLVHLLEFGHRVNAKAYPHVQPTELKYQEILFKKIKEIVNKV